MWKIAQLAPVYPIRTYYILIHTGENSFWWWIFCLFSFLSFDNSVFSFHGGNNDWANENSCHEMNISCLNWFHLSCIKKHEVRSVNNELTIREDKVVHFSYSLFVSLSISLLSPYPRGNVIDEDASNAVPDNPPWVNNFIWNRDTKVRKLT